MPIHQTEVTNQNPEFIIINLFGISKCNILIPSYFYYLVCSSSTKFFDCIACKPFVNLDNTFYYGSKVKPLPDNETKLSLCIHLFMARNLLYSYDNVMMIVTK